MRLAVKYVASWDFAPRLPRLKIGVGERQKVYTHRYCRTSVAVRPINAIRSMASKFMSMPQFQMMLSKTPPCPWVDVPFFKF